ncbi:MAG: 6-phosphofructokinase [Bacillota bacterium]
MQKIAVLTSGGDAPGMNAAIRAVVRKAIYHGLEVLGVKRGFSGFIEADIAPLNLYSVADIVHRGGTILRTARCEKFKTPEGRKMAKENVDRFGIQGLVVIGGGGSFQGARIFSQEHGLPVMCIPGTIDNDISGTDYSIGFDTAVNTVVEAINKIRDTATSHERTFVVEVMGRDTGFIALSAGLAGGAESIIIPERPFSLEEICARLERSYRKGSSHSIIVVAEGAASGVEIAREIRERTGLDTKVTILGHLQRGGSPTAFDRILASMLGAKAVEWLIKGGSNQMAGYVAGQVVAVELERVLNKRKNINMALYDLAGILSI